MKRSAAISGRRWWNETAGRYRRADRPWQLPASGVAAIRSFALPSFWNCYRELPEEARALAAKQFRLFRENPFHSSLGFARKGNIWTPKSDGATGRWRGAVARTSTGFGSARTRHTTTCLRGGSNPRLRSTNRDRTPPIPEIISALPGGTGSRCGAACVNRGLVRNRRKAGAIVLLNEAARLAPSPSPIFG